MIPRFPKALLNRLIWLYVGLLFVEGALRKWVLPGLTDPLLIIRDPLVLLIYAEAFRRGLFKWDVYTIILAIIALLSGLLALVVGHGHPAVALFGMRTLVLHFPLIFVIARAMDARQAMELAKAILWIVVPMTLLIVAQFAAPQSAWVNRAPGGIEGGGFSGALGKYRPPGSFSFTTGVVQFYSLATALFLSFILQVRRYPSTLFLIVVASCLLLAIPISISRTLFLLIFLTSGFWAVAGVMRGRLPKGIFAIVVFGLVGLAVVSQFEAWDESVAAFSTRWENSTGEAQGGVRTAIVGRFLEDLQRPFSRMFDAGLFGAGTGYGTQVGAKFISGDRGFVLGEGEWDRIIGEMGPILGLAVILLRCAFCFKMAAYAQRKLSLGLFGPWVLLPVAGLLMFNGQWGQPTTFGFMAVACGLFFSLGRPPTVSNPATKNVVKARTEGAIGHG